MKSWLDTPLFLLDDMLMMIEKIQYVLAVMEQRRSVLVFFYFFSVRYWMKLVHYVCPMTIHHNKINKVAFWCATRKNHNYSAI